jgi:hypothetical protein
LVVHPGHLNVAPAGTGAHREQGRMGLLKEIMDGEEDGFV